MPPSQKEGYDKKHNNNKKHQKIAYNKINCMSNLAIKSAVFREFFHSTNDFIVLFSIPGFLFVDRTWGLEWRNMKIDGSQELKGGLTQYHH